MPDQFRELYGGDFLPGADVDPNLDLIAIRQASINTDAKHKDISPNEFKVAIRVDQVDNTPDLQKPISNPTQAALDVKKTKAEISSVAALRAFSVTGISNGDVGKLKGYYSQSDGGEGDFYWDSSSTETDDGGLIIAPTGVSTGRWKRIFTKGDMRAAWFGVKSGTTTDQSALIKLAMQKVADNGGGNCWLDAGTFRVFDTLYVPDKVSLRGQGKRVTILSQQPNIAQASARAIIDLGDPDYPTLPTPKPIRKKTTIADISFDLFNNPSAKGIRLRWPNEDVTIIDCECWLSDVENGNPRTSGGDRHFIDMSVTGQTTGDQTLPDQVGIFNLKIIRCNVSHGVQLTSNAGRGVSGLLIDGCRIEDPIAYGIAITSVATDIDFLIENVIITNCVFKNCNSGIQMGRDATGQGVIIPLYQRIQQMRNVVIANNEFILGGVVSPPSAVAQAISVSTYQSYCRRIKIHGNTISARDGFLPQQTKGIQVIKYDYNWLSDSMAGVPPVISSVNTTNDTITLDKPGALYSEMSVRFERTNSSDVLPTPLLENKRYLIVNSDPTNASNSTYGLKDIRTGNTINITAAGSGSVKVFYAPCVQDVTISNNTIDGVSEAIYITDTLNCQITDNTIVRGNVRSIASGLIEDIKFRGNVMNYGTYRFDGRVSNGLIKDEVWEIRDDQVGISDTAAFSFLPTDTFATQNWDIIGNTVKLTRNDGNAGWRVTTAFRSGGSGQVRINYFKRNGVSRNVARPFSDLSGSMISEIEDNKILKEETDSFVAVTPEILSRILDDARVDNGLREYQSNIALTGRSVFRDSIVFEGRNGGTGSAQGNAILNGVSFGIEGRAVNWRYIPGNKNTPAGLWCLSSSAVSGHMANALYCFELNGILTVRQVGATAGTLNVSTGAVTSGDYKQVTTNIAYRQGLPTHILVSITRLGVITVYVEGVPAILTETTSGTAPAWNNSALPSNPILNFAYVDVSGGSGASLPSYEGAFYNFDILNYAPNDSQANQLFAGGIEATPTYSRLSPAETITNGNFSGTGNWITNPNVVITGGAAVWSGVGPGSGITQTSPQYAKGSSYRLQMDITSYTSGILYVGIGASTFRPAFTPTGTGTYVYEGLVGASDNTFTIRNFAGLATLSIDNISMMPIGAVASYVFDAGAGYQIEDKNPLGNHMLLDTVGWSHSRPATSAKWFGKVTGDGYFLRNGNTMESNHYITRINAYSVNGGSFTLGETNTSGSTIVGSTTLASGERVDLTLLKRTSPTRRIYADLGTATDLQLTTYYDLPRIIQ